MYTRRKRSSKVFFFNIETPFLGDHGRKRKGIRDMILKFNLSSLVGIGVWRKNSFGAWTVCKHRCVVIAAKSRAMQLGSGLEPVPATIDLSALNNRSLWFEYINDNYTSGDEVYESDHFAPCTCIGASCNSLGANCLCINNSSGQIYDNQRRLVNVNPYSANLRFLQECNILCSCSESCTNRNVQHGVTRHLVVFDTNTSKGLGVRAGELIPQYSFVCEYAGHARMSTSDDFEKPNENPSSFNYILYVNEIFGKKKMTTIIDATEKGNVSRLINHSCDPNLFMVPVRVNNLIPHVALFALRDIEMGEELSYTYSGNLTSHQPNLSTKPCLCGSLNCKLFLPL